MLIDLLLDGFFAAIAAIGFGSISNVPIRSFKGCALLAAMGHATRYFLMNILGWNIIPAAFMASIVIGVTAPKAGHFWRVPTEALAYPALLPMIPGMYAYRAVEGLLMCITCKDDTLFNHDFYLFWWNGMICSIIIVLMVLGLTISIQVMQRNYKG